MHRLDVPTFVAREYSTLDRLAMRRLDRKGWLRHLGDEWSLHFTAIAEVRPHRVLDAGCGRAELAAMVAAPEVVCVDTSEAAVEAARARGLEAHLADVRELPFEDGAFDVVMCNHMLYHVPDRARAIAELARVLRPGGRFVGMYSNRAHLRELWNAIGFAWPTDDFDGENGTEQLAPYFGRVERRQAAGEVLWAACEDLQAYLDAFVELIGPRSAPAGPYPFIASRSVSVFVADK